MLTKKGTLILSLFFVFMLALPLNVLATDWYTCDVERTGAGSNNMFVKLSDTDDPPEFTDKWFILLEDTKNQMLATILTAMSTNRTIQIGVDDASVSYPIIQALYIYK